MRFSMMFMALLLLAAPTTITGPYGALFAEETAVVEAAAPAPVADADVAIPAAPEAPAADEAKTDDAKSEGWSITGIIGTVVALIISFLGVKVTQYLGRITTEKAEEARAKAKAEGITNLERMRWIATAELFTAVNELNATEMPKLVEMAGDGKINKAEAKAFLNGLRDRAIEIASKRLAAQGVDLVADLGMDWVHGKIREIVDDKSPFLGSTVDALFSDRSRDFVSEYGTKLLGKAIDKLKGDDTAPEPEAV